MKEISAKDGAEYSYDRLFPHNPDSSRLLVGCPTADYSASRIAMAVEDADARLLNLNLTSLSQSPSTVAVALRVSHRDPERVARSLERYGYEIISVETTSAADDTLRRRYEELMHILNL